MLSWVSRLIPDDHFADFFFGGEFNNKNFLENCLIRERTAPRFFLNLALAIPKIENLGTLKYLKYKVFFAPVGHYDLLSSSFSSGPSIKRFRRPDLYSGTEIWTQKTKIWTPVHFRFGFLRI